jgi:prepilin-type processing-associated H-X9-DG protein
VTSLDVFTCPSSGDKMRKQDHLETDNGKPFKDRDLLSYAYSYNGLTGNKAWTEAAPSTTRILTDRHALQALTTGDNHKLDGRNVAFQDGHVKWVSGKEKLYTDPDNPDTKVNTQYWWSERR